MQWSGTEHGRTNPHVHSTASFSVTCRWITSLMCTCSTMNSATSLGKPFPELVADCRQCLTGVVLLCVSSSRILEMNTSTHMTWLSILNGDLHPRHHEPSHPVPLRPGPPAVTSLPVTLSQSSATLHKCLSPSLCSIFVHAATPHD